MQVPPKAVGAALGLLAALALGWGLLAAGSEGLAFGLFAFLTIGGALACTLERSVVRSAFALMAVFVGTAGLFLMLGADFIAVSQILIYVGGILALLLFGVMLAPPDPNERQLPRVLGAIVALGLAAVWVGGKVASTVKWSVAELPEPKSHAREIGVGFLAVDQYVVAFELAAVVLTVALIAAVYIARRRVVDFEPASEGEA